MGSVYAKQDVKDRPYYNEAQLLGAYAVKGVENSQEHWDLTTKDNFPLAYGVYIFHVDAPGIGEKLGRFAVIK